MRNQQLFGINYKSLGFESGFFHRYLEFAYPGTFNITDEHKLLFNDIITKYN